MPLVTHGTPTFPQAPDPMWVEAYCIIPRPAARRTVPDSGSSAGAACPCGQPCAGTPGGRGRTSSRPPAPHGCPSCPRCPSGCGSPHRCSLRGETVRAGAVPGGPRCLNAHCGPGTGLGEVQAQTRTLSQVTHRLRHKPGPFLRNAENMNTQSDPEKQQKCLEEEGVTPSPV